MPGLFGFGSFSPLGHEESFVLGKDGFRFCLDDDELHKYPYQIAQLQLNQEAKKWPQRNPL